MKLSIITVNLNNREGLRKTAQSILDQTFTDYEWIVVDGASTDGSVEVANEFAQKINAKSSASSNIDSTSTIIFSPNEASSSNNPLTPTALVISEPDTGIYNAMNKGILKSQGEYCFFLNSGDYLIDGNSLQKAFELDFTEDVVYGFFKYDRGDHFEIGSSPKEITLRTFVDSTIQHTGNVFIRRKLFNDDQYGLYDESLRIVSDWKWFLQALGLGTATARYIDVMMSVFDCTGISSSNIELCEIERNKVLKDFVPKRILNDYMVFHHLEDRLYKQELQIRSSKAYRLGRFLLAPFRRFKKNSIIRSNEK